MKRSEMREQVFKQLFLMDFYNKEEFGEQCRLYLETEGQAGDDAQPKMTEADQEKLCARAQAIAEKKEELGRISGFFRKPMLEFEDED
jgi:hypothetical protein